LDNQMLGNGVMDACLQSSSPMKRLALCQKLGLTPFPFPFLFCRSQRLTAARVTPTLSANTFRVSGGRLSSITSLRRFANIAALAIRRDFTLYARLPVIPCLCRSDSFPLARCWSTLFASARAREELSQPERPFLITVRTALVGL
jgi:hypothetical protein